jgi:hypothetical protein
MDGGLILVIAVSIIATVIVAVYYIWSWWLKKKSASPPNPPEKIEPPEPPEEQPTPPPPEAPPVRKIPEYLGNSNTMEIHDLRNLKPACQIERMNYENKIFFDNFEEAKEAMESKGYNGCRWCLSQYHTD